MKTMTKILKFIAIFLNLLLFFGISCNKPQKPNRTDLKLLEILKNQQTNISPNCKKQKFYKDGDNDGYGNDAESVSSCKKPKGYSAKGGDCDDSDPRAHPGQKDFFSVPRKNGSFDFDCDGKESKRLVVRAYCKEKANGKGCIYSSGWDISEKQKIPACGKPEAWAWNECRNELLDVETEKKDTGEAKTAATPDEADTKPAENTAKQPERSLPYTETKQKVYYKCWTGHLKWKKRQLCR